ncbi:MAG TPA: formate dehydrogenase subunit alpha, partial [Hyphomicrobiaceae bacterium]|nr:formate dehydrogenase subunit alpha [Hyphomicrobiaceae bacterium]
MPEKITFTLDGREVEAEPGETLWQVAQRHGTNIPHLCWHPAPGYRADGNCRACMVEVEGERVLAASCQRKAAAGMKVKTASERARKSRQMVFELLLADQPLREESHDPASKFWDWVDTMNVTPVSRFPRDQRPPADTTHSAIAVNLDACINCGLCVRACREVQANDVIGMAYRGHGAKVVFDFDEGMGRSTCVACGECVQVCPTGALMEKGLLDAAGRRVNYETRSVDTLCPYCGVGCQTKVHVKDDKILYIDGREGPANAGRLCVKGRFGFDYVHHPDRLRRPLIRRDGVGKDANLQIRREDILQHFREASWEEALAKAALGLKAIHRREGGTAIAGFGSAKGSNEEAYLFQKLIRQGFASNNVDHCTRLCHASSVAALMEGLNSGAVTAPFTAAKDAECIIVIGARPTENHPVAATFLKNAAARGAKLIVMDPRGHSQGLARYASHILQFKPGRDVALLNAMLNVIIAEGMVDIQYVQAHTEGFESLKAKVADFTPEKMEPVCGIAATTIREVARLYARSERSIIFWGMGISQHTHGTDNARCLIALALVTGQVGRPGTGLHPLRGQNNVQGASDAGLIPMVFPDYQSVEDPAVRVRYEAFWGVELPPKKGLTVVEIMHAIKDDTIKGMYIMGENPAMSDPDVSHAREALAKLEHLVVQDLFLTETAWHADVILPASAHAEKWGTFTNTNRQVQIGRPVIRPPGEARQDWELIQEIAQRIGLNWAYRDVAQVFAEMTQVMPSLNNITWERLVREDAVTYPCDAPDKPGNEIIFANSFPTASGRAKIVPADLLPPDELPDAEYPLVLTTGRLLEHWHTGSMTRRASNLDTLEPEAIAGLNPRDMEGLGVEAGGFVRVSTRRGEVVLKARADRDVAEGMVFIPFCFAEAAANLLTNPQLDP